MTPALLDINDSNLQLWNGTTHVQSPGYALLDGSRYLFGNPARGAARRQPRDINTRFWWQLNMEPLQPALGPARHTADLVHAHLQALHGEAGEPPELLLAVSGGLQREQLSLLLGIIQVCPFDAVGLVHRSVALASSYAGNGRLFHLEIQLHQALVTELANDGDTVTVERSVPLPGCGLLQLQERLVEIIAAAFVRQTRFDPRRKADTEQTLYDILPDALRDLQRHGETNIEVNGYRARVNRKDLLAAGQRLFTSAPEAIGVWRPDDRVLVDPIAALLPGLTEHFDAVEVLAGDALPQAVARHLDILLQRDDNLNFVSTLPCTGELIPASAAGLQAATPAEPEPAPARATHLLLDDTAYPLPAAAALPEGYALQAADGGWRLAGPEPRRLSVNDADYRGQALGAGDRIRIGDGQEARLIEVLE